MNKEQLRKQIIEIRNQMTLKECNQRSQWIVKSLESLEVFQKASIVALFYPIGNEVHLLRLLEHNEKRFVFPKIVDKVSKTIGFAPDSEGFSPGIFNTTEPIAECINEENIDLYVVPGLVFDRKGNRIGYGQGYYDLFLKGKSKPMIGVGFHFQLFDAIPFYKHDVSLNIIVTDEEILCIQP